jgi:hypothetical protein
MKSPDSELYEPDLSISVLSDTVATLIRSVRRMRRFHPDQWQTGQA